MQNRFRSQAVTLLKGDGVAGEIVAADLVVMGGEDRDRDSSQVVCHPGLLSILHQTHGGNGSARRYRLAAKMAKSLLR